MQRIEDPANIDLVRQIVQAHAYWRLKGLAVGLVIWNEERAGYRQGLQEQIMGLIAAGIEAGVTNRPGEIFVRPAEQISNEDRVLLQTVARAIISDSNFSAPIHAILPCSINMPARAHCATRCVLDSRGAARVAPGSVCALPQRAAEPRRNITGVLVATIYVLRQHALHGVLKQQWSLRKVSGDRIYAGCLACRSVACSF
jgi:hypothetical protein